MSNIKFPSVAGLFYPSDSDELKNMIRNFLNKAELKHYKNIHGLIAPHAGYIYSGLTAAFGYKQLTPLASQKWKVFVMAPSHYVNFQGVSIGDYSHFRTPLGDISVDSETVKKLLKFKECQFLPEAYAKEHSLEVQLPFLQTVLPDFELIPIILGEIDYGILANILNSCNNENSLFIASSDLSHFYHYDAAKKLDNTCVQAILTQDIENMKNKEACGKGDIITLMHLAKNNNWRFELIDYRNSGDITDMKEEVVGYASLICLSQ